MVIRLIIPTTKSPFDYGFKNFKSVPVADQDSTYSKVADDLTISGIFPGVLQDSR